MAHDDDHHHDHGQEPPADIALRVKALESLLVEKGLVDPAALDAIVDHFEHKVGPRNGARVVARAWTDPAYRERLRQDATAAIAELGYAGAQGEGARRAAADWPLAGNGIQSPDPAWSAVGLRPQEPGTTAGGTGLGPLAARLVRAERRPGPTAVQDARSAPHYPGARGQAPRTPT